MKKIIIFVLLIISLLFLVDNNVSSETIIPDSAIRFRVIGNSNTVYDQNIKLQIRNVIQNKILELTRNTKTIEEVRTIMKEHQKELYDITNEKLKELNYDKPFKLNYGYNYFPKKKYKGVTYKEGNYESLVITLGEGNGNNFWCVIFPPLCMAEIEDTNEVEYKFFVKEIIDKYLK